MKGSSCAYEVIRETLQATGNSLSVSSLCSMAGVSQSGYYTWPKAAPIREAQEQKDREDFDLIPTVCVAIPKGQKACIWPSSIWNHRFS